jgi:hypothetical protein
VQKDGYRLESVTYEVEPGDRVPAYMLTDPVYRGGQVPTANGCAAKRWVPAVMDRIIALHQALGARFDQEPYIEGVTTEESAIGAAAKDDGSSARAYIDQLKRLASAMPNAYPHTLSAIWINWSTKPYTQELVTHLATLGVGTGGPDATPTHLTELIPQYTDAFAGKLPILMAAQPTFLVWRENPIGEGTLTLDRVFKFAVSDTPGIHATHLFHWYFKKKANPNNPPAYDVYDSIALIKAHKGQINSACPTSITCQGTTALERPRRSD